ncbi:MAG: signal peptide peptidase SppA [Desulfomonilaceae bacterium]|nr:signal peptide peptidase SppA [Desulfomonilaceae bacterium]
MKKSRAGLAILFLFCLMMVFVVVALMVSPLYDSDGEAGGLGNMFGFGKKIGVIKIEGTVASSDETLKQLRRFGKRSSVKAIVLRINSPGGAVAPAQEIYREIRKTGKKKPIVASMETVGASAAYYIASAADEIVCSDGTITGSIGVIMFLADLQELIRHIGVNVNVIKAGKYKDIGSSVRPLTDEERKILETFAEEIHEQFIKDVTKGRKGKIDEAKLRTIADGRFFTGAKAKEMGLVDTIGNFYDAVKIAGKRAGITDEMELVYPKKRWDGYLDLFLESVTNAFTGIADQSRLIHRTPTIR